MTYLLKFLEFIEKHYPSKLAALFNDDIFVYANVPYKIKSYADILKNSKDTIDFDHQLQAKIEERRVKVGADGSLLRDKNNKGVPLAKKLAKLLNINNLVITSGSSGAFIYNSKTKEIFTWPAFASSVVDKVGAGDTMLSIIALLAKLKSHHLQNVHSKKTKHSICHFCCFIIIYNIIQYIFQFLYIF